MVECSEGGEKFCSAQSPRLSHFKQMGCHAIIMPRRRISRFIEVEGGRFATRLCRAGSCASSQPKRKSKEAIDKVAALIQRRVTAFVGGITRTEGVLT